MKQSIDTRVFYHIYPLGMLGAETRNHPHCTPQRPLTTLIRWIPHMRGIGINALYLGPVFESTAHGYDTADYFTVDRRLGNNSDLQTLVHACHEAGIAVVLDAVLNHTGRDFFAFKDIQQQGAGSRYRTWYMDVDFSRHSPAGDSFSYQGWAGNYDLAKLNTACPEVKEHLFQAVKFWMEEFGIDGLRLDAADVLDKGFREDLAAFCASLKPDFWLVGEVVHGDYREWVYRNGLDAVTNYEAYKGLWSSFNDRNMHEIAWSLNRQFGSNGIYRDMLLYNFADNHDVERCLSVLTRTDTVFPLHILLFTMPGIPSVYYGSEWGIRGSRKPASDKDLRPALFEPGRFDHLEASLQPAYPGGELCAVIQRLSALRAAYPALRTGQWKQLAVSADQLVFSRTTDQQCCVVIINGSQDNTTIACELPSSGVWVDVLNDSSEFHSDGGSTSIPVDPVWGRILVNRN